MQLNINGTLAHVRASGPTPSPISCASSLSKASVSPSNATAMIVPRSRYADTPVAAGDALEIVGAVGGG